MMTISGWRFLAVILFAVSGTLAFTDTSILVDWTLTVLGFVALMAARVHEENNRW